MGQYSKIRHDHTPTPIHRIIKTCSFLEISAGKAEKMAEKKGKNKTKLTMKEHLAPVKAFTEAFNQKYKDLPQEEQQAKWESVITALDFVQQIANSENFIACRDALLSMAQYATEHKADLEAIENASENLKPLAPFLQEELQKDDTFTGTTLADVLIHGFDESGQPTESNYLPLIEKAQKDLAEFTAAIDEILGTDKKELPRFMALPVEMMDYPLDKPNNLIWDLLCTADENGQFNLNIDTTKKGADQEAIILYSIDFNELPDGLKIKKQLTPFDKRCYIAVDALYRAGNKIMTETQIYKLMGNKGTPGKEDIRKIDESLTKMRAAIVYVDNESEAKTYKGYAHLVIDGSLLPFDRITATINGQVTEGAISVLREPPLLDFARQRKQITTFTRQLLESPISKTEANLRIDDYLIERIGHMKNPKSNAPHKILYKTMYEKCGITTAKQKQRAPEKIKKYLTHYKKVGWIADFKEDETGINIRL